MKSVYATLVLAFLTSSLSYAQTRFGLMGSLQSSNLSISASGVSLSFDRRTSFRAGVMADMPLSGSLSFRPAALYSSKGFVIGTALSGGSGSSNAGLNYLEVPLQLNYSFPAGSGYFVVGAGPYLGYLLSSTSDGQSNPIGDEANRFDLGGMLSAGYDLATGLTISAYFAPGFTSVINENAFAGTGTSASTRNSAFGLNVGYFFGSRN